MLILSLKHGDRVAFTLPDGTAASAHVLNVGATRIRLGLEFPRNIQIVRDDEDDDQDEIEHGGEARVEVCNQRHARMAASV